jgi:hypothetical protein
MRGIRLGGELHYQMKELIGLTGERKFLFNPLE